MQLCRFLLKQYKGMKKIFIGIDFSKEKFDATVIKAEGVEERSERKHSKFAASKKKDRIFLLSKVRFPTFVVRRRNRPAGEGNSGFDRGKPIIRISPPSHVAKL